MKLFQLHQKFKKKMLQGDLKKNRSQQKFNNSKSIHAIHTRFLPNNAKVLVYMFLKFLVLNMKTFDLTANKKTYSIWAPLHTPGKIFTTLWHCTLTLTAYFMASFSYGMVWGCSYTHCPSVSPLITHQMSHLLGFSNAFLTDSSVAGANRSGHPRFPDLNPLDFYLWGYLK